MPVPDSSCQDDPESESSGEQDLDRNYYNEEHFPAYFKNFNPANDKQKWLHGFHHNLKTPDCG